MHRPAPLGVGVLVVLRVAGRVASFDEDGQGPHRGVREREETLAALSHHPGVVPRGQGEGTLDHAEDELVDVDDFTVEHSCEVGRVGDCESFVLA